MSTKFYCNSEACSHADKGPFVFELATEAVLDGNNLATIFCPRCGRPMKQLSSDPQTNTNHHRFYCHSEACSIHEKGLFFVDLPEEAIMDNNNLATIFCPKCGKKMTSFDQRSNTVVNL